MNESRIVIQGAPVAKKRPRFARRGKFVTTYNCQETEEGKVRWDLKSQFAAEPIPSETPIMMDISFYMPIPSSMSKKARQAAYEHTKKPDLDNLIKFIKDCGNGVIWSDDSQIFEIEAQKIYSENPRTEVTVRWG